jgi:hypothetical protein
MGEDGEFVRAERQGGRFVRSPRGEMTHQKLRRHYWQTEAVEQRSEFIVIRFQPTQFNTED